MGKVVNEDEAKVRVDGGDKVCVVEEAESAETCPEVQPIPIPMLIDSTPPDASWKAVENPMLEHLAIDVSTSYEEEWTCSHVRRCAKT